MAISNRDFKFTGIIFMTLALSGCGIHLGSQPQPPAPVKPVQPEQEVRPVPPPVVIQPVPAPPRIQTIDWSASIKPLVTEMLHAEGITAGSVLLVDNVKNSTNGSLSVSKATAALQNMLDNNGTVTLVTSQQVSQARQALGLSAEDSLTTRSKAIGLARYLNANYVLYSNAEGDVKAPELQMQLMLATTGEIIWSGTGAVQH